ncbi:ARM repeat superfamily protein [Wolffia australiana]
MTVRNGTDEGTIKVLARALLPALASLRLLSLSHLFSWLNCVCACLELNLRRYVEYFNFQFGTRFGVLRSIGDREVVGNRIVFISPGRRSHRKAPLSFFQKSFIAMMDEEEPLAGLILPVDGGSICGKNQDVLFSRLRFYCLELLTLVENPNKKAPFLDDMIQFLCVSQGTHLQPCLDYMLLPLFLLLDGAIACRSQQTVSGEEKISSGGMEIRRHVIGDKVAEVVLRCLEELLKKCHLLSVEQMVMILKKLALGASLPPSNAAEEFREGVVKCLQALLLQLETCSLESCVCGQVDPFSIHMLRNIFSTVGKPLVATSKHHRESKECLLAFLQSSNNSAAVGHWLSLLLKIAEAEAERGLRGSSKLRKEALLTLRILVAKVGMSDALAFFLPGVLSRLGKALYINKSMLSGAGGNVLCIDQCLRALSELLVIVLGNEANADVLEVEKISSTEVCSHEKYKCDSILESLRQLHVRENVPVDTLKAVSSVNVCEHGQRSTKSEGNTRPFYVQRTKEWIEQTSLRVDQLLAAVLPHLCTHPSEKIRLGIVDTVALILPRCSVALKRSKLMLFECLCVLVCDGSETVSLYAQEAIESFWVNKNEYFLDTELSVLLDRLIETFPQVVLGVEESSAVAHAQKLSALIYYAGPDFVIENFLQTPPKVTRFMEFLGSAFSHSSLYSGPLVKLIQSKPLSAGYLHSIAELKAANLSNFSASEASRHAPSPQISFTTSHHVKGFHQALCSSVELPRMPPWFINEKLYMAFSTLLRLLGLALTTEHRRPAALSLLIEGPLEIIRKLISEIRMKNFSRENWHSWYSRSHTGHLVRQASAASCILNEVIYATSDQSADLFAKRFQKAKANNHVWRTAVDSREQVISCVAAVLSEYLSPEIWELPTTHISPDSTQGAPAENLSHHFFRDSVMLHQVIVEGIGIFNISIGTDFAKSGFMHSSIYLLLQNLICSSNQVSSIADAVLRVVSTASGYPTVGHLVVSNSDYIIDSLCRQLRHLDLNPYIPDVLSAMLSYVGAASEILPLLKEPMRSISRELEVLSRNQHPGLTVPFLKAVREIIRASRREATSVSSKVESFLMIVNDEKVKMESLSDKYQGNISPDVEPVCQSAFLEGLSLKLNELRRYRRIVGSISESCLTPAGPLLASSNESACLVALDIVEDGITAVSKVEEAYKREKEAKETIEKLILSSSNPDLQDLINTSEDGPDENRLLPMMNKIWPFLVLCMKNNRSSVAAIRRCASVISATIGTCGGDFFIRRLRHDGPALWGPLAAEKEVVKCPVLPYRALIGPAESSPLAEASVVKAQEAILGLISDICLNPRSAAAMESTVERVASLVVAVACSGIAALRDAAVRALVALARIDADLVWVLLADVVFFFRRNGGHCGALAPPLVEGFPGLSSVLPPPSSLAELLHLRYIGGGRTFRIDPEAAEIVFRRVVGEL